MSMEMPDPWEMPSKKLRGSRPHHMEADHLSKCILERAPDNVCAREFVEHRFRFPLTNYRRRSTTSAGLHIAINLLSTALGLATASIVAAGGDSSFWKAMIIAVGLVVSLLAGVNQVLRPGQRNLTYARTWLELRTQGWQYVWGLGDYGPRAAGGSDDERTMWALFVTRVIGTQHDAEKIAEPGGEEATAASKITEAGGEGATVRRTRPDGEQGATPEK
ncbi:MAG: DUF4231 domain-containing protein [Baekduia sp.]